MSVSGLENSNLQVKKPELIKFEVSKKQLIGEPWPSSQGGRFQNILFADGWMLTRPVERLHETEDGKIAFWLAKYKKDGTDNKITLRRSRRLEETDENDKPVYKNEEIKVKIEELKDIEKYGKEKYRFQKEAEKNKQVLKNKERFEVVETEDINEPFSVIDNETRTLLQTEENLPYRFYTKASADAFAKDANELAQDGLIIRCHKDKAYAFCKIAVSQNALALYFIQNQTMELALDAVYQNPAAIVAVKDTYKDEIVKQMPEMIFNKMQRGKVAQNEVIHHLLSLDSKSNYSVFIVTEDGKRHEIKAENISSSTTKLTKDTHSYTALSGEKWIRFNDKNIEEVQYRGAVAAFYDTNKEPQIQEAGIRPRSRAL